LFHDRDDSLHCFDSPEEIRIEHLTAIGHAHIRNRVEQAVPGVVDPDIDSLKVMHNETDRSVNFLTMANIAGDRQGLIGAADPRSRCL
jgi:hypothetical protein